MQREKLGERGRKIKKFEEKKKGLNKDLKKKFKD